MLGRVLGHYELVARLGAGGMGAVYRGVHQTLQQPRAVKILRPDLANEPDVVARFRREAMIAASLRHPHIVLIYDVAEDQDIHYIVMDLLVGGSLRDVIRSSAPLPFARAMHLLGQLASSLDYAHGRGVIHRDIKPGNVMVSADDEVTLVDFGIARAADEARLTRSGTVVGTAEYMAPESFTSEGSEKSSDLYALGIIAYELLTGHAPFRGNPTAVSYAQVNTPPPPARTFFADVPEAVEAVLLKQLAKGPAERFPDATSFVEALKAAGEGAARDNVPTTAFDRPTIAPLPPLPQAPTALQTPLPGSSPPGQAPPSGAPPGTPSSTPAPTIMQSPPGVQRPATLHQGTSPPVGPPPTVVQPSQSGTPVPPGPYGPQQQSTPLPPRGYVPPPQSTPPPPGARPGAPYPAAPPDRSSTIRVVVFSLVVLAVVLLGSIAIWFMTSAPSEVASATPTPYPQATSTTVAAVQAAATTVPQAVLPTAPAAKPTTPPAEKPAEKPSAAPTQAAVAPTAPPTTAPVAAAKPTAPPAQPTTRSAPKATNPPAPKPTTAPPVFRTVLDENFDSNQRGWPDNPEGTAWITPEGVYHLFAREPGQFVSVGAPGIGPFSDVEITGRFRKVGGPPGGGYGIIIRDQEPQTRNGVNQAGHYYVLEAGEGTQWGAWRRDTDRWVELVPWTETKAVKMPPELNEVTVRAIGPRFTFIVNGTEIATIQDSALERGTVGIYVAGDGNEVEVEQYTVRAPQ